MRTKLAAWEALSKAKQEVVATALRTLNKDKLDTFDTELENAITRQITKIIVLPLHGRVQECADVLKAIAFVRGYDASQATSEFDRFEVIIHYSNGDKVNGEFRKKQDAIEFLENYLPAAKLVTELPVRAGVKVVSGKATPPTSAVPASPNPLPAAKPSPQKKGKK